MNINECIFPQSSCTLYRQVWGHRGIEKSKKSNEIIKLNDKSKWNGTLMHGSAHSAYIRT